MAILVTGGAGFLGARLVAALVDPASGAPRDARIVSIDLAPCPVDHPRVTSHVVSLPDPGLDELVTDDVRVVFHLAAVVSGQAEAEFDLGLQVNVDGTRRLLEACRHRARSPRFVFASTIAVYGGVLPPLVPDDWIVAPESSYGAGKLIAETLVVEYTRRRFVDGIVCRLPAADRRNPAGPAEQRRLLVRQRDRPRAARRDRRGLAGSS